MRLIASLFVAWCFCASPATAQLYLLPYAGYTLGAGYDNGASYLVLDTDDLDAQGGLTVGLGADFVFLWERLPFALSLRPSVEATLVPGETADLGGGESLAFDQRYWQASLVLLGDVPVGGAPTVPFLGFGFTYARYSADFDTTPGASVVGASSVSAWELAPTVVAGVRYDRGRVSPLFEARYRFATPEPAFSAERPGADLDNGFSLVAGARIAL
jgi:hypothetical protein